jgi:hypothetical protein
MILNNYWKYLNAILTISPWDVTGDQNIGLVALGGEAGWIDLGSDQYRGAVNRNFNTGTVVVGTGDTAPNANDYALANDCTSSISNLNYTINSAGTDGLNRTITITGFNNSSDTLTIKEVGYAKTVQTYEWHTEDHEKTKNILMCRVLLNEPLEVAAGASFLINLAWNEA